LLSFSLGARYRAVVIGSLDQSHMSFEWSLSEGPGLRPRGRVAIGWAWR